MLVIYHNDIDTMTMNIMNEYIYNVCIYSQTQQQHNKQHKNTENIQTKNITFIYLNHVVMVRKYVVFGLLGRICGGSSVQPGSKPYAAT